MSRRHLPLAIVCLGFLSSSVAAEDDRHPPTQAAAVAGTPYGVAHVALTIPDGPGRRHPDDVPITVAERNRRVLYPSVRRIYERTDSDGLRLDRVEVHFLFTGDEPLDVAVVVDRPYRATVPMTPGASRGKLGRGWWADYRAQFERGGEPSAVETYLVGMLGRRLQLATPRGSSRWRSTADPFVGGNPWTDLVALMTGTASVRTALQHETLLDVRGEEKDVNGVPLPKAVVPPPVPLPRFEKPSIEAIATRVPEECFYIRYARSSNVAWLASAAENFSALLGGATASVAFDDGGRERLQRQLALPDSTVSRLFGDDVVGDMAMIGTDLLVQDGASVGFLFEVHDERSFDAWITRDRAAVRERIPGCVVDTVEIDGRDVTLLHTPQNDVRSFLVSDGPYRLVTNSRFLARRFLETGRGVRPLGSLEEFAYARSKIGVERRDPVFVYLSDPFFRFILGPHYRVEMTRRVRASGELELVELAHLAARAEGRNDGTIAGLVEAGFLPPHFGDRFDGSRAIETASGVADSLRGSRGCFVPVPDVAIEQVTPAERSAYLAFGREYARVWQGQPLDPVVLAISPSDDAKPGHGRIVVDVLVTPFARVHYPNTEWLAIPTRRKLAPVEGTLAVVDAPQLVQGIGPLVAGIEDFAPAFEVAKGEFRIADIPEPDDLPWFFGTTPQPFLGNEAKARHGDWAVDAASIELAQRVAQRLKLVESERPAHVNLRVADLGEARIRPVLEAVAFAFARDASARNVDRLHDFAQQFRIEPRRARDEYERLLRGRLVCPLGGDYRIVDDGRGPRHWTGSYWPHPSRELEDTVPQAFRLPLLDWFHGLELELAFAGDTLISHVELIVPETFLPEDAAGVTDEVRERRRRSELLPEDGEHVKRVRELGGWVSCDSAARIFEDREVRSPAFPANVTLSKDKWTGTTADWKHIAAIPTLGRVTIDGVRVGHEELAHLADAPEFQLVSFGKVAVDAKSLAALAECESLHTINFIGTAVTAEHIEALKGCRGLRKLVILDASGFDVEAVDALGELPALESIRHDQTTYTVDELAKLRLDRQRVTTGQKASWSSDGKRLAYSEFPSGRGIGVHDFETGRNSLLVSPGKDPAWRPGHDEIAYVVVKKKAEIRITRIEDGSTRTVAEGGFPQWSADGKRLYYHTRQGGTVEYVDVTEENPEPVEVVKTKSWFPAISPDGTLMAHQVDEYRFAVRDLRTGKEREFEYPLGRSKGIFSNWSPDNRYLALGNTSYGREGNGLWVLEVKSGKMKRVVENYSATMPAWSPDGKRLAYDVRTQQASDVYVAPLSELDLDFDSKNEHGKEGGR